MSTIFDLKDLDDFEEDVDIDTLYESKKDEDIRELETYNKILQKIHHKIKQTSRLIKNEQWCWFQLPLFLLGSPKYNFTTCTNYILNKLTKNGFQVKLMNPNLLLISWRDWIPLHVRDEIKYKMGKNIDGFGNIIKDASNNDTDSRNTNESNKKEVRFKSTGDHEPIKNIVYSNIVIDKLNK